MKILTVIRHGKANTGATDAETYDRLAPLGFEQAALMGAYIRETGKYKKVRSGDLRRHIETVEGADFGLPHKVDPRLNELPYFDLGAAICERHGLAFPSDDTGFQHFFRLMMEDWDAISQERGILSRADALGGILDVLKEADEDEILLSSGGVIGLLGAHALDLDHAATARFVMPIAHTSIHRFGLKDGQLYLIKYCSIPHLDQSGQSHLVTMA